MESERVKVFIRVKPESHLQGYINLAVRKESILSISKSNKSGESIRKVFQFNRIFGQNASQLEIYKHVASSITDGSFQGYNGTIFAYGQSGTGKTHTILGNVSQEDQKGVIPNIFSHIFAQISLANKEKSYAVTVTFLEIYNEEVKDLLGNSTQKVEIRENPKRGVYAKGLTGYTVESLDQVLKLVERGKKKRSVGSTKLNDVSSRSHAIFTISIEARNKQDGECTVGKLNLVDLAGSERVSKSLACGERLREAGKINLSLSVLGNVISALVDGKTNHVPYRNSKLTRLLQDSLGGNSRTSMIATISIDECHYDETLYTLMYADRVKHVTNSVKKNQENVSVLKTFEAEIQKLQAKLEELESKKARKLSIKRVKQCSSKEDVKKIVEDQKCSLLCQIETIQKKILIGGENLLEKAQVQLEMMENNKKEIKHLDSCHQLLQEVLNSKGEENIAIKQQHLSLEEEDQLLDLQIKETEKKIAKFNKVLLKKEQEYQNEISNLLYTNKCLGKEIDLASFIINNSISKKYLQKIEENIIFDEETQDFRINYVHLTANNVKSLKMMKKSLEKIDFGAAERIKSVYKSYNQK